MIDSVQPEKRANIALRRYHWFPWFTTCGKVSAQGRGQTTSSPPFFLRDSRASERARKSSRGLSPRRVSLFLAWANFHARSRFVRSTIPEEKWGTTRSLGRGRWAVSQKLIMIHSLCSSFNYIILSTSPQGSSIAV